MESFRLPAPRNTSATLAQLAAADYVRRRSATPSWTVTPLGHRRVLELIGAIDADQVERELASHPGAELGKGRLTVLPPALAPSRWAEGIASMLSQAPFDNNVLCMTRFPDKDNAGDPLRRAIPAVRDALSRHGLTLHLADDRVLDDDLLSNVAAYMWACRYGVALLEDRVGRGINGNVLIELGAMVMAGRRCLLLKDHGIEKLPTDIVARIYKPLDVDTPDEVAQNTHVWARDDLGLGGCVECPPERGPSAEVSAGRRTPA